MGSSEFIEHNLAVVKQNIQEAYDVIPNNANKFPQLVSVSKLQPKESIIEAYKCGQRHFGENYIQELHDKSNDPEIREKCPDIKWHIIGHIQGNKINKLLDVPNLHTIQTVDSQKLANALDSHISRNEKFDKINVFVQVNTSNEDAKSGISPENVADLVKFILEKCNQLRFVGLMTIGAYGYDVSLGPNPDFLKLLKVRDDVCQQLSILSSEVDLSMGMSSDYAHAVELGSTCVRVGTSIFGERQEKHPKKV